uniref:Uncharacterized protein n=1 Tax=Oryza meridionalis TaxID=40149 RepID=A0A0E0E7Q0_9ORYZ
MPALPCAAVVGRRGAAELVRRCGAGQRRSAAVAWRPVVGVASGRRRGRGRCCGGRGRAAVRARAGEGGRAAARGGVRRPAKAARHDAASPMAKLQRWYGEDEQRQGAAVRRHGPAAVSYNGAARDGQAVLRGGQWCGVGRRAVGDAGAARRETARAAWHGFSGACEAEDPVPWSHGGAAEDGGSSIGAAIRCCIFPFPFVFIFAFFFHFCSFLFSPDGADFLG